MFKTSLKVLALLIPSLAYAQDQSANATIGANSTAPAGAGETVAQIDSSIDWSSLEALVNGYGQCNPNITADQYNSNSSNPLYFPADYEQFFLQLPVDWQSQENLNFTTDTTQWNATQLKSLLFDYVDYHNAVAQSLGGEQQNATNSSSNATTIYAGFNFTNIDQVLNASDIWQPAWDNADLLTIIDQADPQGIAYEVVAYYYLFFSQNGVMMNLQNATEGSNATGAANATQGAANATQGASNATDNSGFLQGGNSDEGAAADQSQDQGSQGLTASQVYMDADFRIKQYAENLACAIVASIPELQAQNSTQPAGGAAAGNATLPAQNATMGSGM